VNNSGTNYLVGRKRMMNNEQGISNDEVFFPSTFPGSLFDIRYLYAVLGTGRFSLRQPPGAC
ncbi:MAG: hypothetical protein AB1742_05600, partial [bacterium]